MAYVGKNKWTVSRVVAHVKKVEVHSTVTAISGERLGEKRSCIPAYAVGLKEVVASLSKEEEKDFQGLADLWNKGGLPDDLRRKSVS